MAAPMDNVRIRLSFSNLDGFPVQKPLKSWFLINFKYLDTISDFEVELRRRFALVRTQELVLHLDGYALPPWESAQLLRDGDEVRVSGCPSSSSGSCLPVIPQRTAQTPSKTDALSQEATVDSENEDSSSEAASVSSESSTFEDVSKSPKSTFPSSVTSNSTVAPKNSAKRLAPSSSSGESESEETIRCEIVSQPKESVSIAKIAEKSPKQNEVEMETNSEPKKRCRNRRRGRGKKGTSEEAAPAAPIASEKSVTVTEYQWSKGKAKDNQFFSVPKNKRARQEKATNGQHKHIRFNSESEGESEQPDIEPPQVVLADSSVSSFAKEGALNPTPTFMSSTPLDPHPKGRKKKGIFANVEVFKRNRNRAHDTVSDISVIPNNGDQCKASDPSVECPMEDYSQYPVLKDVSGIPRTGDHIAFKIVEMTENYTPEVSAFKEAKVLSYNPTHGSVTLQLMKNTSNGEKKKLGRFDITVEKEGEILTNVESQDDENQMTVQFTSLLDCKLLS